jgi:predicted DCC family thiol-disulfide oxidoreductase YuxK
MSEKPVILFDGVCNLCNGAVQFVIKHDHKNTFNFASLQSDAGQSLLKTYNFSAVDFNSFVLIQNDKAFLRSDAALRVVKQLSGSIRLLYGFIIVPKFIRDYVYRIISKNRYKWFGKKESCMIPSPQLRSRFLN